MMFNFLKKSLPRWQYKIIPILGEEDGELLEYEIVCNHLGEIGWELVTAYRGFLIFKKHAET